VQAQIDATGLKGVLVGEGDPELPLLIRRPASASGRAADPALQCGRGRVQLPRIVLWWPVFTTAGPLLRR
jgi:hypothetical protein